MFTNGRKSARRTSRSLALHPNGPLPLDRCAIVYLPVEGSRRGVFHLKPHRPELQGLEAHLHDGNFSVYILASRSRAIYVGYTRDLERRIYEHKMRLTKGHASKYHEDQLVYVEDYSRADDAIAREKQLKGWSRSKKIALIESSNPEWHDLTLDWEWEPFEE